MIFLNSASSAAALVFYLPGVCTHTDTKGKQRKARVRNIFKSLEKTQYLMNTLYKIRKKLNFLTSCICAWSFFPLLNRELINLSGSAVNVTISSPDSCFPLSLEISLIHVQLITYFPIYYVNLCIFNYSISIFILWLNHLLNSVAH